MTWVLVIVYVHVMSAILLVGYSLFWALMTAAARRKYGAVASAELLETLYGARWPPLGLPTPWRMALPHVVWVFLLLLLLSGFWLLAVRGLTLQQFWDENLFRWRFGQLLGVKLLLVALFLLTSLMLLFRHRHGLVYVNLVVALSIGVVSALLLR